MLNGCCCCCCFVVFSGSQVTTMLKNILLIVALVVVLAVAENDVKRVGVRAGGRQIRSTLQACRKDFRKLCIKPTPPEGSVAPQSRRNPNECLAEKVEQIENDTCKTWVKAENVCKDAAKKTGMCTKNMDLQRCFAKVVADDLPTECTTSDFYKALVSPRNRPFRHPAAKKEKKDDKSDDKDKKSKQ